MIKPFKEIRRTLYTNRLRLLLADGIEKKLILPFEKEVFDSLDELIYDGVPVGIYMTHIQPNPKQWINKRDERSVMLSLAFKDCHLMQGYCKCPEEDHFFHCWVENDGWVYDPTYMMKFKKELYYKVFKPNIVEIQSRKELEEEIYYQECLSGNIHPTAVLCAMILLEGTAEKDNNQDLKNEMKLFKEKINYDADRIEAESRLVAQEETKKYKKTKTPPIFAS